MSESSIFNRHSYTGLLQYTTVNIEQRGGKWVSE